MGTATILGDTYSTVIMPDGKEWLAENCKYSGLGVWWNSGVSNDGDGRYYSFSDIQALNALLADGWRVPTYADTSAMILASRDVASNHCWSSCLPVEWPNAGRCTNANGFSATPSGYFRDYGGPSWVYKDTVFYSWNHINIDYGYGLGYGVIEINEDSAGDVGFSAGVGAPTNDFLSSRFPVRLVRDEAPPPICWESSTVRYVTAIDWDEATDGTPVGYDDGTAYDYIEATITGRLKPAELVTLEAAWQSSTRLLTIESTGFLLGPTIDTSTPGVSVRLMEYTVDGPADSAMTLFDVTVVVRKGSLVAPTTGSLDLCQASGVPYHAVAPLAAAWGTESGDTDVSTYGRISTRSCMWYTEGLTNAQAADVVNALRTLRSSATAWNTSGNALPFGPGQGNSHTVYIPSWELVRQSNLSWMAKLELVRSNG